MIIKLRDKYYTFPYFLNLMTYGPPPKTPNLTLGPFPSPPRDRHLPIQNFN